MGELDESEMPGGGDPSKWMCDKCAWKQRLEETTMNIVAEPRCCMCMLHGGALKQTDENTWAHIVCVLCVKDENVTFKDPVQRLGVHVPAKLFKNESRQSYRCVFCEKFAYHATSRQQQLLPAQSITVKCDIEGCERRFHVTCAHMYDACLFDLDDWPECVFLMCDEHAKISKLNNAKSRVIDHNFFVNF